MYVIRCSNVLYVIRCSNVLHVIRCFETTVQWGNTFTRTGPGILKRANDWLYCHHHHHNHCHHSLPQIIHNIVLFTSFPLQGTCLRRMWKGFCGEQQTETTPAGSHRGKAVPVHFWGLWKEILPRLQPEDTRAHTHGRPPLRLPLRGPATHQIESSFLMLVFAGLQQEVCAVNEPEVAHTDAREAEIWSRLRLFPRFRLRQPF